MAYPIIVMILAVLISGTLRARMRSASFSASHRRAPSRSSPSASSCKASEALRAAQERLTASLGRSLWKAAPVGGFFMSGA